MFIFVVIEQYKCKHDKSIYQDLSRHFKQINHNTLIVSGIILKKSLKNHGLTQNQAAVVLEISRQTLNTWCGKSVLDEDIIENVKTKLSIDLIEEARKQLEKPAHSQPQLEAKPLRLADPYSFDATNERFYKLADDSLIMQVPVIKAKAYAGYLVGFSDPEYFDDVETIPLPVDSVHRGSYLAFEVSGRSMVNYDTDELADMSIRPGWIAIGRDIPKDKWKYKLHTHSTDTWIIVHRRKGILIKQIIKHDVANGKIAIHSLNPEYNDEELNLHDIEQIFSVVQIINKKR